MPRGPVSWTEARLPSLQIIEVVANLFELPVPALAHGVNIDGEMGAGVAVEFRDRYPAMHEEYQRACRDQRLAPGEVQVHQVEAGLWVYNLVTEDRLGHARLEWVAGSVAAMAAHADSHGIAVICTVRIGCGLGGLEWGEVRHT